MIRQLDISLGEDRRPFSVLLIDFSVSNNACTSHLLRSLIFKLGQCAVMQLAKSSWFPIMIKRRRNTYLDSSISNYQCSLAKLSITTKSNRYFLWSIARAIEYRWKMIVGELCIVSRLQDHFSCLCSFFASESTARWRGRNRADLYQTNIILLDNSV